MKTCSIDECENRVHAKGLCNKHYLRKWKHGDPTFTLPRAGGAKHGMFGTPTWNSWSAMKNRCLRPTCANCRWSTASDQMKNRRPFKRRWAKRPIEKEAA